MLILHRVNKNSSPMTLVFLLGSYIILDTGLRCLYRGHQKLAAMMFAPATYNKLIKIGGHAAYVFDLVAAFHPLVNELKAVIDYTMACNLWKSCNLLYAFHLSEYTNRS